MRHSLSNAGIASIMAAPVFETCWLNGDVSPYYVVQEGRSREECIGNIQTNVLDERLNTHSC